MYLLQIHSYLQSFCPFLFISFTFDNSLPFIEPASPHTHKGRHRWRRQWFNDFTMSLCTFRKMKSITMTQSVKPCQQYVTDRSPQNHPLLSDSSILAFQLSLHECAKSMMRMSWIKMKMKDPTIPKTRHTEKVKQWKEVHQNQMPMKWSPTG